MDEKSDHDEQIQIAREAMDRYQDALAALAGKPASEKLEKQMEIARKRIEKYRVAYRELSK